MMNTDAAIVATSLTVARGGREVLHGIDVTIPRASVVGLLGPSGGGKSTFIRAVVGVQIVASGEVRVFGEPAGSPALRRRVGYVTQSPSVYGDLSVRDNVAYFGAIVGASHADVDRAIETVGLTDHAMPAPTRQSVGGPAQSAPPSPARWSARPELLVLDEPTVGLDPVLAAGPVGPLFHRLAGDGATLLVSSHVMDEAARCDRLCCCCGPAGSSLTRPRMTLLARTGERAMRRVPSSP
jgi:ABC-2 type transport system ATP-binding protein